MNGIKLIKSLKNNWTKILSVFFFIILLGAYAYTFAVPPATKYSPGEIRDPDCGPGDTNCSVEIGGSSDIKVSTTDNSIYSDLLESPSVKDSIYLGYQAGYGATEGDYYGLIGNNFIGNSAGHEATNVVLSNFIGQNAGYQATDAMQSNFFGFYSGQSATNAHYSNFFGTNAGAGATEAGHSNFFGAGAGSGAINASYSNFIGDNAGNSAISATGSNFLGADVGSLATNAHSSNFLGYQAGYLAVNSSNSNFLGTSAGYYATNASHSNFLGNQAGYQASGASYANFLGEWAGKGATNADLSTFMGYMSGYNATNASGSIFLGYNSGYSASSAASSIFVGQSAGYGATSALGSSFIGNVVGYNATNAYYSIFLGNSAGMEATNARNSIFIGGMSGAGDFGAPSNGAINAANSIFIGSAAGLKDVVNNTANFDDITTFANTSILIGHQTRTGGYSNSIALGAYATNTATNQFMIGSVTRPINQTIWNTAGGTTCTLISTGLTCTSDEDFKTNIEDLDQDTLDKLLNVKTITYNWKEGDTDTTNIGFLAQDLEDYFPELVSEDVYGNKSVNYANMTPILVEAVRELDLKVKSFMEGDSITPNSLKTIVKNFLEDFTNGLEIVFFGEVHTKKLCLDDICIDKAQLEELLSNTNVDNNTGENTEGDTTQGDQASNGDDNTSDDNARDGGLIGDDNVGTGETLTEEGSGEIAGEEIPSGSDENIQEQGTGEVGLDTSENN